MYVFRGPETTHEVVRAAYVNLRKKLNRSATYINKNTCKISDQTSM